MLAVLLSVIAAAFIGGHVPFISDVSESLALEAFYALGAATICVRVQRKLGALRGQADAKSITYISQGVYGLVVFFYTLLIVLMSHLRGF
jgi:hypothetical protein